MRALLLHGWKGEPLGQWRPWLNEELKKRGFEVILPQMPNPNNPLLKEWLEKMHEVLDPADEELFLVGHSLGCIAILRYLSNLQEGQKVGGVVLVAGYTDALTYPELSDFYKEEIEWGKIKKHCNKFVVITSDNDPRVPVKYAHIFEEKLGANFILEHGKGHFNKEDGVTELPSALDAVLSFLD